MHMESRCDMIELIPLMGFFLPIANWSPKSAASSLLRDLIYLQVNAFKTLLRCPAACQCCKGVKYRPCRQHDQLE